MTNHTGMVDFIFWDAKTGRAHELNSSGTLVSGLPPFRPLPPNLGVLIPATPPCACIPGFMPGLKATSDYHMGSFHMSWRDPATGLLNASADARRAGQADGY